MIVHLNGKQVPLEEARISPLDHGFLYAYGLFETMRSYGGVVFRLQRHLERLMRGAEVLGLNQKLEQVDLKAAIYDTLKANDLTDARLRLMVTAGEGLIDLDPVSNQALTIVVVAEPLAPPPPETYEKGISAVTASGRRSTSSPTAGFKVSAYADAILSRYEAREAGADDALILSDRGFLAEGTTSNVFLVDRGALLTPGRWEGILPGVTREVVLEMANNLNIPSLEGEILPEKVYQVGEAFLTSTVREIVPLVRVDGRPIGDGAPGPVTRRLMAEYRELVAWEVSQPEEEET